MQLAWILLFYDKEWVRTQFSTVYETANGVQLKYFCKVRIYVLNVHHRPKHLHSDVCEISLLIAVCSKSSQIYCSALLALEWSWAFSEACEMLQHCTPRMIVKWVEVWWFWWSFILRDEVDTDGTQPVLHLTGCVSWNAVLLEYESRWKQLFAVVDFVNSFENQ